MVGRKVKGCNYAADDEKYEDKRKAKANATRKSVGMSSELKKAEKKEGYSKKPRVKGQKKNAKPASGQKKVY